MRLPRIDPDKPYQGLFVVDFAAAEDAPDTVGVGYTAEEVAMLLEQQRYRDAHVYRIHRLLPDGTVELKAAPRRRFETESAFVFCSRDPETAQKDFGALEALADADPLPCRARLLYGGLGYQPEFPWVAALLFPAEYEDDVSTWLLKHDFQGGEIVDAGTSHATTVSTQMQVRDRAQLPAAAWRESRSREEVLRAVGETFQR